MASKQVALELADFLDSAPAGGLGRLPAADVRRVAEAFFTICYEELGKRPNLMDGDDVRELLGTLLPRRLRPRDRFVEHVPAVLEALLEHVVSARVTSHAFEMRRALHAGAGALVERVRSGANAAEQAAVPSEPYVHGASKLGRNDPCSCGSGKKYKQCHGKRG